MAVERRYSDDSGVEFGVTYTEHPVREVEIRSRGELVTVPTDELEWLIDCLHKIKWEIRESK